VILFEQARDIDARACVGIGKITLIALTALDHNSLAAKSIVTAK